MKAKDFDARMARRLRQRCGPGAAPVSAGVRTPPGRRREIAELAEAVAEEHCPSLPVDPLRVAQDKRITWSLGSYGDAFDGMLEHQAGRFHIFCNQERVGELTSPRARFTVAHELGHYFIDEHRLMLESGRACAHLSACEYESPILAEEEADAFAASLLLPAARFAAATRVAKPGLAGVRDVAAAHGVSVTAAAIRLAELDLVPCAVVKWNWRGYAWKHLSASVFQSRFRRTFESPQDLPEDSPTRRALAHETPPADGFFRAGTVASAWFRGVLPESWRNIIFIEEVLPLGRYGVLTLLRGEGGIAGSYTSATVRK